MSRYHSYLNSAAQILKQYDRKEPFALFIKKYFAVNKKFGSIDRKQISHLCYCYFRLGKSLLNIPIEERISIGLFLCSNEPNEILQQLKPEWNKKVKNSIKEKYSIFNAQYSIFNIFPWKEGVSDGTEYQKFCESFFIQPDLFLRMRPGYEKMVEEKLLNAGISFKEINSSCLSLPNNTKIENIIELDKEAVVQDYNSQRIGESIKAAIQNPTPIAIGNKMMVWDCCAGSGGKSLLLYDLNPNIDLTVTDRRNSIIVNLQKRFKKAGIKKYKSLVADLTNNEQAITDNYDFIIADIPCTGSGTWSRTPEQLYYFKEETIEEYASLQKKIVSNVTPYLKSCGYLLYITCSVFKMENEEVVDYIRQKFNLELVKMELLKGYDKRADTMFAALMKKIL
jgi:16S rRNA (cytosine967-C5)-methyltransferase